MEEELSGSDGAQKLFSEFKMQIKSTVRKLPRCDSGSQYNTNNLAFMDIKAMFQLSQSQFFSKIESPPISFTEGDDNDHADP